MLLLKGNEGVTATDTSLPDLNRLLEALERRRTMAERCGAAEAAERLQKRLNKIHGYLKARQWQAARDMLLGDLLQH